MTPRNSASNNEFESKDKIAGGEQNGNDLNSVEGQMEETQKSNRVEKEGADVATPEIEYLAGLKLWLVMIALLLAMFLVALDMVNAPTSKNKP